MISLRPIPVRSMNPLGRVPMLGRARLAQGGYQPAPPASPADNLAQNGAILQVTVAAPTGGGQSQTFQAMIDSGASISCITMQGAQAVGLPQVSSTQLGGVGGSLNAPVYGASLTLPQFNVSVSPVQIAGVSNPLPNVDMLIGRDILAKNLFFAFHGGLGTFNLSSDSPSGGTAPAPGSPAPAAGGAPAPAPAQGQPGPAPGTPPGPAPMGQTPGTAPTGSAAPPPPPPQGNLPQPPASGGTVLGMSPGVAAGVGAGVLAVGAGALKIFKVI